MNVAGFQIRKDDLSGSLLPRAAFLEPRRRDQQVNRPLGQTTLCSEEPNRVGKSFLTCLRLYRG